MPVLRTRRLTLRAWAAGDEAALVRHADNWNVARNLREVFPHPYTRRDAEAWIACNLAVSGPALDFAIVLADQPVGGIGLRTRDDIARCSIELGYWVGEPFWGRGIASEAIPPIVAYAFATFPEVQVVQACPLATNPASARVLEKCGFRLDGRLRQAAVRAGVVADVWVYSLTRGEHRPGPTREGGEQGARDA